MGNEKYRAYKKRFVNRPNDDRWMVMSDPEDSRTVATGLTEADCERIVALLNADEESNNPGAKYDPEANVSISGTCILGCGRVGFANVKAKDLDFSADYRFFCTCGKEIVVCPEEWQY